MSKSFSYPNKGTCSKETHIVLNDDHTIESVEVVGGCNGNLKGISRLLKGMKAEDVIDRMEGTLCGFRNTRSPGAARQHPRRFLMLLYLTLSSLCAILHSILDKKAEESELTAWNPIPYPPAS